MGCTARYLPPIGVICGLILLIVGIIGNIGYIVYTPVYSTVTCSWYGANSAATSDNPANVIHIPGLDSIPGLESKVVSMQFQVDLQCSNPNPYSVQVESTKAGSIFMGLENTVVGAMATLASSLVPAYGNRTFNFVNSIKLSRTEAHKLLPQMRLDGGVPLKMETNMNIYIWMPVFGVEASESRDRICGMMIENATSGMMVENATSYLSSGVGLLGPLACADHFDALVNHAFSDANTSGDIEFTEEQLGTDVIEVAELRKNAATVSMMVIGYLLGTVLIVISLLAYWRYRQQTKGSGKATAATVEAA